MTKLFPSAHVEASRWRGHPAAVSRDGDTIAFPPAIIVNDIGLNMHRSERIIERLDQPPRPTRSAWCRIRTRPPDHAEKIARSSREAAPARQRREPPSPAAHPAKRPTNTRVDQAKRARTRQPLALIAESAPKRHHRRQLKAFERIECCSPNLDTRAGEGGARLLTRERQRRGARSTLASLTRASTPRHPRPQPRPAAPRPAEVANCFGRDEDHRHKGTNSWSSSPQHRLPGHS